jgi:hypothetical protein
MRAIATSMLLACLACIAGCGSCSRSARDAVVNDAGAINNTRPVDAGLATGGSADAGVSPPGPAPADAGTFAPDAGTSEADAGTGPGAGDLDAGTGGLASSVIGGCQMLPANHIFNTPIADQPVSASSADYLATIGATRLRLDTGTDLDQTQPDFYGLPYNVVHGNSMTWTAATYYSADTSLDWDPRAQSDCAVGSEHTIVSPCIAAAALQPVFPIPAMPLVQDGISTAVNMLPYADHRMLILDADTCRLWELAHAYPALTGGWFIFGSATFDLRSDKLRPAGWTSTDAAGMPVLPLLLRAEEASSGAIRHALRFSVATNKIRTSYTWPARHLTTNGTASPLLPPMGQLFRLKAGYAIPATDGVQAQAILQALKTYGMYIADGGLDMYVAGAPSPLWEWRTFAEINAVPSDAFEAVDLSGIARRPGFDPSSGAVP